MPKVMDRVNSGFLGGTAASDARTGRESPPAQRSAMRILRERLPARLQNAIARAVPVAVRDRVVNRQISAGHDWGRTPGIALLADLNGYLRWNLRGRERRGMLEGQGEPLERYIAWVRECLLGLRTPGAEVPLVREVLLTRDHFPGKRSALLPDAIVTWTGLAPASRIYSAKVGALTSEPGTGRAGNHRSDGFCVIVEGGNGRERHIPPPQHISELGTFVRALLHE